MFQELFLEDPSAFYRQVDEILYALMFCSMMTADAKASDDAGNYQCFTANRVRTFASYTAVMGV